MCGGQDTSVSLEQLHVRCELILQLSHLLCDIYEPMLMHNTGCILTLTNVGSPDVLWTCILSMFLESQDQGWLLSNIRYMISP